MCAIAIAVEPTLGSSKIAHMKGLSNYLRSGLSDPNRFSAVCITATSDKLLRFAPHFVGKINWIDVSGKRT